MKYKLTELKGEIDNSTTTARDSNILLSITDIRPEHRSKGKRNCEQQYKPKRPNKSTEPSIHQQQSTHSSPGHQCFRRIKPVSKIFK